MFKTNILHKILGTLVLGLALTSCVDEALEPSKPAQPSSPIEGADDEFTLDVALTLDVFGGTPEQGLVNPMRSVEDYIDPERCRILFFDYQEKFLFESKSRWVRKLSTDNSGFSEWLVSVPFFSTGNDVTYNWDWDYIRDRITKYPFKIVILANRPEIQVHPDLATSWGDRDQRDDKVDYFDNSGPHWTAADTNVKSLIDLHHAQWDPVYTQKGQRASGAKEGYYDFIMGKDTKLGSSYYSNRTASATSAWVDFGPNNDDTGNKDTYSRRYNRMPSQDYPIPMYGVQEFDPITTWTRGTPFNLSKITKDGANSKYNLKSVSLLRSVVKLELLVSRTLAKPTYLALMYSNIYARAEPMDIWTPTDKLWAENHDNGCEWDDIFNYGNIVKSGDPTGIRSYDPPSGDDACFDAFRDRIAWFYSSWAENGPDGKPRWTFGNYGVSRVQSIARNNPNYPRMFNPITQRNTAVRMTSACDVSNSYSDGYYHFIIYTGERNINDPVYLANMSGYKTDEPDPEKAAKSIGMEGQICAFKFNIGSTCYLVPIKEYTNASSGASAGTTGIQTTTYSSTAEPDDGSMKDYFKLVYDNPNNRNYRPWPLLRNHVYRIVIGGTGVPARNGEPAEIIVNSEEMSSSTLKFQ